MVIMKKMKNSIHYAKWLWQYTKPYLPFILLIMGISISSSLLNTYSAIVTKNIIDSATTGHILIKSMLLYIGIVIFMQVVDTVSQLITVVLNEKFSFGIRKQVYERIIHAHWMSIKKYHTGDLMTRLTSDAGNISNGIIQTIPQIIQLIITFIVTFLTLFYYEPMLAILAVLIAPIAALVSWLLGKRLKKLQIKVQESESRYRSYLQESLANLLIVKSFANEEYAIDRLVNLREERFHWVYKKSKMNVLSATVISLAFQIGYILAFVYGAMQVSNGQVTYGTMTLFLTLVNRIQAPVFGLAKQIPTVVSILASAGRVIELENIPSEQREENQITSGKIGLEVQHLSFSYDEEEEPVFENANFTIQPGEFVALLGESGIGKTTMIRLIMSFIHNYEGQITFVSDSGEKQTANANIREFMAYVPQGNTLFSGSIRDNIIMGKLDATEEEIEEALKLAAAYDFVQELPKGVDTIIGERGHGISEGQAQRIAIARALIRKAPFLILDEATSALDAKTEVEVIEGIRSLTPRPTCFIITHRPSVLPHCNRQIQINNKRVSEGGTEVERQ